MRIILINPKTNMRYSLGYRLFNSFSIPISLAYIASVLEQKGISVTIKDQYESGKSNAQIINEVVREKPQIVGFSCLANTLNTVSYISKAIKKAYNPKIVVGNINAVIFADEILREGIADIVVRGEGEYAMQEIALSIEDNSSLREIKGISYSFNGDIVHTDDRAPIEDIDSLPYPSYHLFDLNKYRDQLFFLRRGRVVPISISRGCNYQCVFCSNKIIHKKFRTRAPESIVEEINFVHNKYGVNIFGLVGSYFPVIQEQAERFCEILIQKGLQNKIKWFTESRVDKVNPGLLKKMQKAGLYFIMFGCDFGTQKMLDKMQKGTTCKQAEEAVRAAKSAGIITVCYFLLGGYGESREDSNKTIDFAKKLDCDIAKFNITVPYPGSKLFDLFKQKHNISFASFDNISSWADWTFGYKRFPNEEGSSGEELAKLQRKAMFSFYFRPETVTRMRIFFRYGFSVKYILAGVYVMCGIFIKNVFSFLLNKTQPRF